MVNSVVMYAVSPPFGGIDVAKKKPPDSDPPQPRAGRPKIGDPVNVRIPPNLMSRMKRVEDVLGLDHSTLIRLVLTEQLHIYEQRARAVEANQQEDG